LSQFSRIRWTFGAWGQKTGIQGADGDAACVRAIKQAEKNCEQVSDFWAITCNQIK
jgi:hypothetical protein